MNGLGRNLRCIACVTNRSRLACTIPSLHLRYENGSHSDGRKLAQSWQRYWRTWRERKGQRGHLSIQRSWRLFCSLFSMDWHCKRLWTLRSILMLHINYSSACCVFYSLTMNDNLFAEKKRFLFHQGYTSPRELV